MLQKLPVSNFEWIKDTCQFKEDFITYYNEESDEGYFLEVDVQYLEKQINLIIYNFYQKEGKFKKSKSLQLIYMIKQNMLSTQVV